MLLSRSATAVSAAVAPRRAPASCSSRSLVVPVRASKDSGAKTGEDNPYHNRDYTKHGNPGGNKDAGATHRDKDEQFAYQQERLEWRRQNQAEGVDDRMEPPHNNLADDGAPSSERRGPEVEGTSGHGDTLKELVDNLTGKKKKHDKDDDGGKKKH